VGRDVVDEVFTREAHQVLTHVADEVLGLVLAPLHPHVAVDGGQTHGHRAAPLDGSLLDEHDAEPLRLRPVRRLVGGAAPGHAAAHDQEIALDDFSFRLVHVSPPVTGRPPAACPPQPTSPPPPHRPPSSTL